MAKKAKDKEHRLISQAPEPIKPIRSSGYSSISTRTKKADYNHWKKKDYWTAQEAAALISGYDPKNISIPGYHKLESYDLIIRGLESGTLAYLDNNAASYMEHRINPKEFIRWAISKDFDVADEFKDLAEESTIQIRSEINHKTLLHKLYISINAQGEVILWQPLSFPQSFTATAMGFKNESTREWNTFKQIIEDPDLSIQLPKSRDDAYERKRKLMIAIAKKLVCFLEDKYEVEGLLWNDLFSQREKNGKYYLQLKKKPLDNRPKDKALCCYYELIDNLKIMNDNNPLYDNLQEELSIVILTIKENRWLSDKEIINDTKDVIH